MPSPRSAPVPIPAIPASAARLPVPARCGYVSGMRTLKPSTMLPVAEDATPLDAGIAPLLAAHPGQSGLALVDRDLDAFAWRALSARQAGRSLDLQYYIWQDDLTGRLLVRELLQAADRGVRVRLLLDDLNASRFDRTWLALDSHPQIEVRLFNPDRKSTRLNSSHVKISYAVFCLRPRPPRSTPFPYTTLFRSRPAVLHLAGRPDRAAAGARAAAGGRPRRAGAAAARRPERLPLRPHLAGAGFPSADRGAPVQS